MKTRNSSLALALCFSLIFSAQLLAQNKVHWLGGTPGQASEWDCPKNWSNHKVPDGFSDVFIGNTSTTTFAYPIISSSQVSINSLYMDSPALLTISENSSLTVHTYVTNVNDHNIKGKGSLLILNEHMDTAKSVQQGIAANRSQQDSHTHTFLLSGN